MDTLRPKTDCAEILGKIVEANEYLVLEVRQKWGHFGQAPLTLAISLEETPPDKLNDPLKQLRDFFLSSSQYKQLNIRSLLDQILNQEPHLKACCLNAKGMAKAIEVLKDSALNQMTMSWNEGGKKAAIGWLTAKLFEQEYQEEHYIHLYNLQLDISPVRIQTMNMELIKLADHEIPQLIGEQPPISFLHNSSTGNCFLKNVNKGPEGEGKSFEDSWKLAWEIVQTLIYLRHGTVDLDYGAIWYRPDWVNQKRRFGISIRGLPRQDQQASPYYLRLEDLDTFKKYSIAYQKIQHLLADTSSTLRKATELAGDFYEGHVRRNKLEDQLIDLTISLEALFSPGDRMELGFRISQRTATLLGKTPNERKEIFQFIKDCYSKRSTLVHGGRPPLTTAVIYTLANYVREAILRLITLQFREYGSKKEVEKNLDDCAFDNELRERLQAISDYNVAIQELAS
ncbi:HEPN domain-containing protein [Candidatus Nitronereus thalassa]|uniref:HEPN domain-containing protein n=1 Tax=Candidatus Nitronereus thalassa TaxID=3020898 RepID=A0ABU3KCG4_9BACT|nr:HEPN domain-containing protein [Candidatus Nitronereus thalassa]MDT7043993.1 HEPN domain-containing protein [Candidatus Nitronereus thalassa]